MTIFLGNKRGIFGKPHPGVLFGRLEGVVCYLGWAITNGCFCEAKATVWFLVR